MHDALVVLIMCILCVGDYVPYLNDYERYYLVKRSQVAKSGGGGGGEGKNANRSVGSDLEAVGFWRMSCGRDIKDCRNNVIGHSQSLNYYRYNTTTDQQQGYSLKIRKKAQKTQWFMHEYTLFAADDKVGAFFFCSFSLILTIIKFLRRLLVFSKQY